MYQLKADVNIEEFLNQIRLCKEDVFFQTVDGDNLNLSISNCAINSSAIYDISGQLRLITNNSDLIDISILPQGVYFITCKTETNELLTSKFLKR